MAPEQFGGADGAGPDADVYALGVIAYQTVTGSLPFTADSTKDWFEQHHHAPMPPLGDGFPPALDKAIRGALHKHRQLRTGSALELADNLWKALRTTKREQLRTSAQQWFDDRCPKGLLWGADVLQETLRSVPQQTLSPLESMFLKNSQRRIRRIRWAKRALAATAVMIAIGWFLYRAAMQTELAQKQTQLAQEQTRSAQQVREATVTQSEIEQGRSALLHDEPDAAIHLTRAYQRGDRSPGTAFMLARALQPRLAEQTRFSSTFGRIWSATFSPDGTQIVTTDDRNAQVWDARTYQLRFRLPHGAEVYQAVYSPDGTRIVTAAEDAVRIWDATNGALVHKLARKATDYFVVAISPNGRLVSAMNAAGSVAQVWDAATGAPLAELRNDASEFPAFTFSSDSRWLATTGGTEVHIFNTQTWMLLLTIRGPGIRYVAFDPTSHHLLTGATTGDVSLWEIPSGRWAHHLREGGDPVGSVAFSPDGQLVAAGSRDGVMQVWRAKSGELQSQLHPRHSKILAMEFDRTSQLILAAGADGAVIIADAAQGLPVTMVEAPHKVLAAHFDPSSRHVVGASWDGTARVWNATSSYRRWSSPPIADNCGIGTSAEPDHRFIAVGCRDHATRVWDTSRDLLLAELPSVSRVDGDFTSAFPAVSSAGDRAAIARNNTVEVYELPGGRLLRTIAHGAAVNAVAFATTGRDIVVGAVDGSLRVTRESGAQVILPTVPGGIDAVEFLPDGRVVAADARRRLRVYDAGGSILADLELPGRVMSLRIERTRLVTLPVAPPVTGNAGPPLLVDLERYRVIARLEGHVGRVFSARWVAGDKILTAGDDRTVRLWDSAKGQLRQIYRGSASLIADATLTPDGLVVAVGSDGLLRFWDKDSARQLWALHAHASLIIGIHVEDGDLVTRGFTGELARWTLPSPRQVIKACDDRVHCAIVDQ